jgi:hypothetical protein
LPGRAPFRITSEIARSQGRKLQRGPQPAPNGTTMVGPVLRALRRRAPP